MSDTPVDDTPIALSPETYKRHEGAVQYVEGLIKTRAPWPGWGRFPGVLPGSWAILASGATISAASGTTLGSGDVNLCDRAGTDSGITVTAYNAGAAITATGGDRIVRLAWTWGDWSVNCPGGS